MPLVSEPEIDAYMSRLADGDRSAFDPIFRALYPRALRLAELKVSRDHAPDVAQSILLKVFTRASEFRRDRPALPWFYAIAAGEVHTHRRRLAIAQRRAVGEGAAVLLQDSNDPEQLLLAREFQDALRHALDSLDEPSALAIASMLEESARPPIAAGAFRKRVSRAYARLRWLLGVVNGF